MDEDEYYQKVRNWNSRTDYLKDLDVIKLLTTYCSTAYETANVFLIGTGLGADIESIKNLPNIRSVVGVEPIEKFYNEASEKYNKIGAKILNMTLDMFAASNDELSGIFIFSHSINHIPKDELLSFKKTLKKSFILVINPNPEFPKRFWWTDETILSYLSGEEIANILGCEKIFDFFYNLVEIKDQTIFVRNAILLKTKDF